MQNLIVVAHPDDEAIWFSTILRKAQTTLVICFQTTYPSQPKQNFEEANKVFEVIDCYKNLLPVLWLQTTKTTKPRIFGETHPQTEKHLEHNLRSTVQMAEPNAVYTDNPFGEYGHSEHVLVHKVLKRMCPEKMIFPGGIKPERKYANLDTILESLEHIATNQVDTKFRDTLFSWYKTRGLWTGAKGEPYGTTEQFARYKSSTLRD